MIHNIVCVCRYCVWTVPSVFEGNMCVGERREERERGEVGVGGESER